MGVSVGVANFKIGWSGENVLLGVTSPLCSLFSPFFLLSFIKDRGLPP